jgi:hypothetical protein
VLRVERLEDRQLLSASTGFIGPTLPAASALVAAHPAGTDTTTTTTGPTISKVTFSAASGVITWNVAAASGVVSSTLAIDGAPVSKVSGPYTAPPGVNYSGSLAGQSAGGHVYTITATDGFGNTSTATGSVTLTGPSIQSVVVAAKQGVITWNAAARTGIASSVLAVDGAPVKKQSGPFVFAPGVNYSGSLSGIAAGNHTYTITATDALGIVVQSTGTFTIGPTVAKVVFGAKQNVLTWNVAAAFGVKNSSLIVDGGAVSNLSGPYVDAPGVNYSASLGSLSAGSHTYTITATDGVGNITHLNGTFTVGPTIAKVSVATATNTITWNVAAALGVTKSTITIDGLGVPELDGPFLAPPGVSYSAVYNPLVVTAGTHNYIITATDVHGNTAQFTGAFIST